MADLKIPYFADESRPGIAPASPGEMPGLAGTVAKNPRGLPSIEAVDQTMMNRNKILSPSILGLCGALWTAIVLTPSSFAQTPDFFNPSLDENAPDEHSLDNHFLSETLDLGQVRSIVELRDVRPTDWSYQALRSLVERYGCIAGYPDSTFRGNRAMTRYEFAAGLNACLDTVNELIASATADQATQDDLLVLQRLQDEFQAELATLRGRVDGLEARTAELESNQFSTTTKLGGEVVFVLNDRFGENADGSSDTDNAVFGSRVRLELQTSFTGDDLLLARLAAGNVADALGQLESSQEGLDFALDKLWYRFGIGKAQIILGPVGIEMDDVVPTFAWEYNGFAEFLEGAWTLYDNVSEEGGIGVNYQFTDHLNVAAAYLVDDGINDPAEGVFKDNWTAFTQLTGTIGRFEGVLAFSHEYDSNSDSFFDGLGTPLTQFPFGEDTGNAGTLDQLGLGLKYAFSPRFILSAFGSYGRLKNQTNSDRATAYTAGLAVLFPDLFREGNEGGIALGIRPSLISNDDNTIGSDDATPFMIDAYYQFAFSDQISIIPGGFLRLNSNGNEGSSPEGVAAIKTVFEF